MNDKIQSTLAAIRQADALRAQELKSRKLAAKQAETKTSGFLAPEDVRGEYDKKRALLTTLGGNGLRPITEDDLRTFAHNARQLGKKLAGGITAKDIIDHSAPERVERARTQIHYALPVRNKGGLFDFMTNAGPDSNVVRHHCQVEFLNWRSATSAPEKNTRTVSGVVNGPLRIQCDCADFRYQYRYMASVGNYVAGRPEPAAPKIKNPTLSGLACKHLVRVARSLSSPMVRKKVEEAILRDREGLASKTKVQAAAEVERMAKAQHKTIGKQSHAIETSAQRRERLAASKAVKATIQATVAKNTPAKVKDALKPKSQSVTPASTKTEIKKQLMDLERGIAVALQAGAITPAQAEAMRKAMQGMS